MSCDTVDVDRTAPIHAHTTPSANCMRLRQTQNVAPVRLLSIGIASRLKAFGRPQRSSCRRREWSSCCLLHTRTEPQVAHGGDDQVGQHDNGLWADVYVAHRLPTAQEVDLDSGGSMTSMCMKLRDDLQLLSQQIIDVVQ